MFVLKNFTSMIPSSPSLICLREFQWVLRKVFQDSADLVLDNDALIKRTKIVATRDTCQWTHRAKSFLPILLFNISYKPMRHTLAPFSWEKADFYERLLSDAIVEESLELQSCLDYPRELWTYPSNDTQFIKHLSVSIQMTFCGIVLQHTYWLTSFHGVRMLFWRSVLT